MMNSTARKRMTAAVFRCGACKVNRKKCSEKCVLAPYFPLDDPQKFLLVHAVFGYGNLIKLLTDLPADQRGDAVKSMVYEARQRIEDPVHGCAGVINDLNKEMETLQFQLDSTQTQLDSISMRYANLLSLLTNNHDTLVPQFYNGLLQEGEDTCTVPNVLNDDIDPDLQLWEPLWT